MTTARKFGHRRHARLCAEDRPLGRGAGAQRLRRQDHHLSPAGRSALDKIGDGAAAQAGRWTAGVPLPGGDFPVDGVAALIAGCCADYPFLTDFWARGWCAPMAPRRARSWAAARAEDLGRDFGATLTEAEAALADGARIRPHAPRTCSGGAASWACG
jgi:hypothetical protein